MKCIMYHMQVSLGYITRNARILLIHKALPTNIFISLYRLGRFVYENILWMNCTHSKCIRFRFFKKIKYRELKDAHGIEWSRRKSARLRVHCLAIVLSLRCECYYCAVLWENVPFVNRNRPGKNN